MCSVCCLFVCLFVCLLVLLVHGTFLGVCRSVHVKSYLYTPDSEHTCVCVCVYDCMYACACMFFFSLEHTALSTHKFTLARECSASHVRVH